MLRSSTAIREFSPSSFNGVRTGDRHAAIKPEQRQHLDPQLRRHRLVTLAGRRRSQPFAHCRILGSDGRWRREPWRQDYRIEEAPIGRRRQLAQEELPVDRHHGAIGARRRPAAAPAARSRRDGSIFVEAARLPDILRRVPRGRRPCRRRTTSPMRRSGPAARAGAGTLPARPARHWRRDTSLARARPTPPRRPNTG